MAMARKLPTWMNELAPVELNDQGATQESIDTAVAYYAQRKEYAVVMAYGDC